MSKILFLIEPVEGHFNPFVPIINELVEREHELVCISGNQFKQRIEKSGSRFISLPEKWDPGLQEIYDFFPELKDMKGVAQIKYYLKHIMYDQVPDILKLLKNVLEHFQADVSAASEACRFFQGESP